LKKIPGIKAPEQSIYWKTASFKEIAPVNCESFWFIRCSSLLRKLYMRKVIGINKLRREYGGRSKNHVHKKHSLPASGAIIRRCLHQLEAINLVKTVEGKGRVLTPAGYSLLDKTAMEIYRKNPIEHFTHIGSTE
jgi:small subunit ribosomal protein S19e